MRSLATAIVAMGLAGVVGGCASACEKVRADRKEFEAPIRVASEPDVALIVPFGSLDRVVAPAVKQLGSATLPLPAVLGQSLGSVALKVESVQTRPAARGRIGFAVKVALFSGKSRLLGAEIVAEVPPKFDVKRGVLTASLADADIRKLEPKLDAQSVRGLTRWIQFQLPEAVRALTPTAVIEPAVAELARQILPKLAGELKRDLPRLFSDVAAIEIDLGELPLARVDVRSTSADLVVAARSTVGRGAGLANLERRPGLPVKLAQLRIAGGTAAGLANHAMADGEIPERYNLDGSPDPRGDLLARASWEAGPRPLKVHLWKEQGECIHAVIGGTPNVVVKQNQLVLSTDDAKLERVRGSVRVRAGIFFSGLGRQTFALVEKVAATAELEVGDRPLKAVVRAAAVDEQEIAVAVALR